MGGNPEPRGSVAEIERQLPRDGSAAWRARELVARFGGDLPADVVFASRLVVTELVANCVQHGGASDHLTVHLSRLKGYLRVWVGCAKGLTTPYLKRSGYRAGGGGLGLWIVEQLATEWGVEDHGLDTLVWATLATDGRDTRRSQTGAHSRPAG
jgi:anti-sigma regulatory factor (Ser/Thr protein kinase)